MKYTFTEKDFYDDSTAGRLVKAAKPLFEEFYRHPFVQGIGSGKLDKEKFVFYMIQDFLYLIEYAKVFAIGVAKAEDIETMSSFAASVNEILSGEMDIHRGYMERLGITREEAEHTPAHLANTSYTSYMIRKAYEGGAAEVTAAILSCAVSYELIACELVKEYPKSPEHPFFGEWVKGYSSLEYRQENRKLIELLNRLTKDYSGDQIKKLEEVFIECTKYEGAFWDMGWNGR